MNRKEHPFSHLDLPKVRQNQEHKKRLRTALLLAHEERSRFRVFGALVRNTIQTMSILQKGATLSIFVVAVLVITAGVLGPSASSVAQAEAQETVNRAFVRLANLSDEERAALEERFQEGMHFKMGAHSPEELEARHAEMRASLTETLAEAQAAPDLRVVSADELPVSGFFGQAGRAFGFKMTRHHEGLEERFAKLPEDIRRNFTVQTTPDGKTIYRHNTEGQTVHPVSFMVYTNADGQTVYLGLNAGDEPVVKFVQ